MYVSYLVCLQQSDILVELIMNDLQSPSRLLDSPVVRPAVRADALALTPLVHLLEEALTLHALNAGAPETPAG